MLRTLLRNQQYETVHAWGHDGLYRFGKNGEETRVEVRDMEMLLVKDSLFLHNHPSGNSFSRPDIRFIADMNPFEFRVVSKKKRFALLRPAKGWPDNFFAEWNQSFQIIYGRHRKDFLRGKIKEDEFNRIVYSETMKRIVKTLKLDYGKGEF